MTVEDLRSLALAKALLETPGMAARLAQILGRPIEKGFELLPANWSRVVHESVQKALVKAAEVATSSLENIPRSTSSNFMHKVLVGASGGIGGALGLLALPVELPISTTLMLRSIADIARQEGHDIRSAHTRMDCLHVFAFGGATSGDDAAESAYWAVRTALGKALSDAAALLTERGVLDQTAPAFARLIAAISARFGVVISEQTAAKAIPLVGAASGSAINVLFMDHFQQMARGHFIVRRLEAKYGPTQVRQTYQSITLPKA